MVLCFTAVHDSRDRILLDGEEVGDDDDEGHDEVFALNGVPSNDSDEDEGAEKGEDDDGDVEMEEDIAPKKKAKAKGRTKARAEPASDEEDAEEEEEEAWGKNKSAYYASNDAQPDSDDEEANALEEQEARRLQSKARDVMDEADFGLGDSWNAEPEDGKSECVAPDCLLLGWLKVLSGILEPSQDIEPSLPQDKKSLIRHLEKTSPETLALANDWEDTALKVMQLRHMIQDRAECVFIILGHCFVSILRLG
jgi:U3 small nucleolar RNA-associated protein 3